MPSTATITSFYTFTANTKARASQVNNNFDVFRGHILPISPNTQTAISNTYDLGSSEYIWRTGYINNISASTISTTTLVATNASITSLNANSIVADNIVLKNNGTFLNSSLSGGYSCAIDTKGLYIKNLRTDITDVSPGSNQTLTQNSYFFLRAGVNANSNTVIKFDSIPAQAAFYMCQRGSSISGKYFQVGSSVDTYYLHAPNQSAIFLSEYTSSTRLYKVMGWDDTQWRTFTANGSWTSGASTYSGKYRKIGDCIDLEILVSCSGVPTAVTLTVYIPFNTDWTIDTTKFTTTNHHVLGIASMVDGTTVYTGQVAYVNTTQLKVMVHNASGTYTTLSDVTSTVPFSFNTGDFVLIRAFGIPITNMS